MNQLVLQACLVAALATFVLSTPIALRSDQQAPLIQYESYDTGNGHHFAYGTLDGQQRDEDLIIKNKGQEDEEIVISGHYSYRGSDGLIYNVSYTADKNGYHATVDSPRIEAVGQFPSGLPGSEVIVPGAPISARHPHQPFRPNRF